MVRRVCRVLGTQREIVVLNDEARHCYRSKPADASGEKLSAPTPNSLAYVRYLEDFPVAERTNDWAGTQTAAFTDYKVYVVQTKTKVVERCLLMTTDPGDIVLDPTCGSGTTAYVAVQWGRRWITTDTSLVAVTLGHAG